MGGKRWLSKGILVFSCLWLGWPNSSYARDNIKPGDAVRFSEQLVSANGLFRLGFFSVRDANYFYFGLLYMEDTFSRKVIIWVANRGKPVIGTTADVTMDTNGMLQIIHKDGDPIGPIPLNSKDQAAKNSSATLTDSGNFVLTEWNPDGSAKRILWQTFDYPADTLLHGMKLGENFQTGKKWSLSSWISDRVPAPGAFTLEWNYTENGGGQLVTRSRGEVYWTSGLLNVADQSFENIVWLHDDYYRDIYNFTVVSSENESYFTYSVPNGNMTMLVLNSDQSNGTVIDSDRHVFGPSGLCNGIDRIPGCEAERAPECRSSNEKFESRAGQFAGGRYLSDGNMSLGFSDCWAQCWNNCYCAGYNASYPNGTCQLWSTEANFRQDLSGSQGVIYVLNSRLNATSPNSGHSSNSGVGWWIWLIVAMVVVLLLLLLCLLCYLRRKKLKEREEKHQEEVLLELTTSERFDPKEIGSDGKYEVKVFSFASIMAATNDFSSENKLGQGGFGPVFKGQLPQGKEIAVKRLSRGSGQGLVEFKNEIILIAKLQHMNLVRLLGCCIHRDEKMLKYEYMPNKSLDFFLFDPTKKEILDWKKRYNIIEGVAQGILYLHKYSRLRIIHRDLKASNILLDDDMNPKISDFGMARIFGRNESEANTNRVVGT